MFGSISLPVTENVSEKILSLPIYPSMTNEDVSTVITGVRRILS
jgi:dTDP-4-amino-4,6-dideoxygalactose transaminase